ncbi:MAG: DUF418 domain-containing protein [Asticcacaulis sp.]
MPASSRLLMIDALRGFALMGLFLLHVIDYYELFWFVPARNPLHDFLHLLVSGKAYSIFALMFGLSFFIIMDGQAKKGVDFSKRFLWRMALLFGLGLLHGLLFIGDILQVLSLIGIVLLVLNRLPTKALAVVGAALLFQPDLMVMLLRVISNPEANTPPLHMQFQTLGVYATGSLEEVITHNVTNGLQRKWIYMLESGRMTQITGLFIIGLVLGRIGFFHRPEAFNRQRRAALAACVVAWCLLYFNETTLKHLVHSTADHRFVTHYREAILTLYRVDLVMAMYVLGFIELYQWVKAQTVLNLLAPLGRMTLTLYVGQSLIFVPLYYGFGAGLYKHMTTPAALGLAFAGFIAQCLFAHFWFKKYHYGPLEWLWRCGTYLSLKVPLRKYGQTS